MNFRMKDLGIVLESRELAKRLSEGIIADFQKKPDTSIRLDFSGVRVVSSFFADELVGDLVNAMGKQKFKELVVMNNLSDLSKMWLDKATAKHEG